MSSPLSLAIELVVCAALILVSGVRLSRYADIIAQQTGLGGTWIGLVIVATVTSLPEFITGASSVVLFDVVDVAAGDVIGSCLFNLAILALLDATHAIPLTARIHQGHVLAAGFGVVQLGLLALASCLADRTPLLGWVGVPSFVFIAVYGLAVRIIFIFQRNMRAASGEPLDAHRRLVSLPLRVATLRLTAHATVLLVAATFLPAIAKRLSQSTGLEQDFVGTLFVAVSTSLPEIVVSAAAVKVGALDMAAANLLGSNLFNVAIIGFDDLLYTRGPLLADIAPDHILTLAGAIAMTGIAIIGLTFRAQHKHFRLSWDALAMLAVYTLCVTALAYR